MAETPKTELTEPAAVANYLATMTAELSMLARHYGFDVLGYLLDMARLEAEKSAQSIKGSLTQRQTDE
ncbi:MAG: hypothetical protein AB7E84_20335 [Xanthobacteraceae bacterium]